MKKSAIISLITLVPIFTSYYILDYFELTFRVWAFWLWMFIIIILSAVLSFSTLCLTIKEMKNKKNGINRLLFSVLGIFGTSLTALFCIAYMGISIFMVMLGLDVEIGVITENGKRYVVQKEKQDIGSGPYYEVKYDYINFIVRSKQGQKPEGG